MRPTQVTRNILNDHYRFEKATSNILRPEEMMHPDGLAWEKCCRNVVSNISGYTFNCAYFDKRVLADSDRYVNDPFPCCHRTTEEGYFRICAGWDACHGSRRHKLEVKR